MQLRWPGSRESIRGFPKLSPLFANRVSGHSKIADRKFEAIRANRSDVMEIGVYCESIRGIRFTRIAPIRVANRQAI